jgi:hypothetical protein
MMSFAWIENLLKLLNDKTLKLRSFRTIVSISKWRGCSPPKEKTHPKTHNLKDTRFEKYIEIMKFTIFAALASSGYAATPEAPKMNAAPANNVQDETPEPLSKVMLTSVVSVEMRRKKSAPRPLRESLARRINGACLLSACTTVDSNSVRST